MLRQRDTRSKCRDGSNLHVLARRLPALRRVLGKAQPARAASANGPDLLPALCWLRRTLSAVPDVGCFCRWTRRFSGGDLHRHVSLDAEAAYAACARASLGRTNDENWTRGSFREVLPG